MALSDNAYTPNLLFTAGDERQIDRINWFNRGIVAAWSSTVITAGFSSISSALSTIRTANWTA